MVREATRPQHTNVPLPSCMGGKDCEGVVQDKGSPKTRGSTQLDVDIIRLVLSFPLYTESWASAALHMSCYAEISHREQVPSCLGT